MHAPTSPFRRPTPDAGAPTTVRRLAARGLAARLPMPAVLAGLFLAAFLAGRAVTGPAHLAAAPAAPDAPRQEPAPAADPRAESRLVWLPELGGAGDGPSCATRLRVMNLGHDPSKAVILTWGEPGSCPPAAKGPLKVECSGLIRPGSGWDFAGAQLPAGSASGLVASFIARPLSELGLAEELGFDDVAADLMCETLFFGVVGDADDFRRFLSAYERGARFAGVPQERAWGAPLAVEVARDCETEEQPGILRASRYEGLASWQLGRPGEAAPRYTYFAPLAALPPGPARGLVIVQNASPSCASFEVEVRAQDAAADEPPCELRQQSLAPGERVLLPLWLCPEGAGGAASARILSDQPLAVLVDVYEGDTLSSYAALPRPPVGSTSPGGGPGRPFGTQHGVPLAYREREGWTSRIHVQNLDAEHAAKVIVLAADPGSDDTLELFEVEIPAAASRSLDLSAAEDLPPGWVGRLDVESVQQVGQGLSSVRPPIAVAVEARRSSEAYADEATAYGLPWPSPPGADANWIGSGLLAVPSVVKSAGAEDGGVTELAVANLVHGPGSTDFALLIYDQNGLLDLGCHQLSENAMAYFDLAGWGAINAGFRGSAVISATHWEHPVYDAQRRLVANRVGLAAVASLRVPRGPAGDTTGDRSTAGYGIPIPPSAQTGFTPLLAPGSDLCGLALSAATATPWPPPPSETPRPTATRRPETPTLPATETPGLYLPLLYWTVDPAP